MPNEWIACDACGSAQALYQLKLIVGELYLCGHHYNKNKQGLDKVVYEIVELGKEETPILEKAEI